MHLFRYSMIFSSVFWCYSSIFANPLVSALQEYADALSKLTATLQAPATKQTEQKKEEIKEEKPHENDAMTVSKWIDACKKLMHIC